MKNIDISIIIVSWNTKDLLEKSINSIYNQTKNISFEIFVIDNNSKDGTVEMIEKSFPNIKIIKNKKNLGFAKANNQGIALAKGKYILALNPDTIVLDNAIEKSVKIIENNNKVGILGPSIYNKDMSQQKSVWSDPSLLSQIILLTKLRYLFPKLKILKKYYKTTFNYTKKSYVDQIQGSFMLIRKNILNDVGLFDEKFFIWFEEVDLCYRTRKAGYKILYSPEIEIIHYGGESFKQVMTIKKQRMYNKSLFYYFWKNKPHLQYYILRLFEIPSLILAGIAGAIKRLK